MRAAGEQCAAAVLRASSNQNRKTGSRARTVIHKERRVDGEEVAACEALHLLAVRQLLLCAAQLAGLRSSLGLLLGFEPLLQPLECDGRPSLDPLALPLDLLLELRRFHLHHLLNLLLYFDCDARKTRSASG